MKKINKSIKLFALLFVCLAFPALAGAQVVNNMYFNLGWQVNGPVSESYADKVSGWGAFGEAGYYVIPNFSVGAFLNYHTNNKYIGRQTIPMSSTSVVTSDQQHSIFQLPFGAAFRYNIMPQSQFQPYIGAKLGAEYAKVMSYMNVFEFRDKTWGFYMSPEVGMAFYLTPDKQIAGTLAFYYSYGTNKAELLDYKIDGMNNWGFRVGVQF